MLRTISGHGKGRAVVNAFGNEASFSELSYRYPLKLLSPETNESIPIAIAYILSYGGGLVSGDRIELDVDVRDGAILMLLTQGSTKVFKTRAQASHQSAQPMSNLTGRTTQRFTAIVNPYALLVLLPDPVTCFSSASYSQIQTVHLRNEHSSLVFLDWFTSGRMARGEEWDFQRYRSVNEIWIKDKRIARDVMLLEQPPTLAPTAPSTTASTAATAHTHNLTQPPQRTTLPLPPRSLKDRLNPYACYATLFLFGPLIQPCIISLHTQYDRISQMQASQPDALLWSLTLLEDGQGAIVRIAGKETELVRNWLKNALAPLSSATGVDAFKTAFPA